MEGLNLQNPEMVVAMLFSAFDTIHSVAPLLLIPKRRREVLLFGMRALPNGSAPGNLHEIWLTAYLPSETASGSPAAG
jgi:hypothetical protein